MAQKIEFKKAVWFESLSREVNLKCFENPLCFTPDESILILYALCFLDFEWKMKSKKEISEFCGLGKNGTRVKNGLEGLQEKGIILSKKERGKSLSYFKLGETFNIK